MINKVEVIVQENDVNFFAALRNPQGMTPFLLDAMQAVMGTFQEVASVYAPENEANHPGRFSLRTHKPMGFYERGRGWWYPLLKMKVKSNFRAMPSLTMRRTKGMKLSVGGRGSQSIQGVTGYKLIKSSEQMNEKWRTNVYVDQDIVTGELKNDASYFPYVQGLEQAKIHAARGWQTTTQSWETKTVQDAVIIETDKAIDSYYGLG
jgi:hypothetical protein